MPKAETTSPDLTRGVALTTIPDGSILAGMVGDEPVILTRSGDAVRAFGGTCTHLGAPLAEGIVVDGEIRCPWHHACFDLETGMARVAPAFDPLPRWEVSREGDLVKVTAKAPPIPQPARSPSSETIVIIGGGAGGYATAHELRAQGFGGAITMVSAEETPPYDRTLLTKDYLDGRMGDDRLPIARTSLAALDVTFLNGVSAERIDRDARAVRLADGRTLSYTKLLLATGAEPKRLDVPGADRPHVYLLRSLADCQTLLARLDTSQQVVVIGSSFVGLEAAASIRSRGFAVTVVSPEAAPMATRIGPELSRAILNVHKAQGVVFHLQAEVARVEETAVVLADGTALPADCVIVGIGVTPCLALAESAGLAIGDGVIVDGGLRTSDPTIFAVGDIACWPDPTSGRIRVEHWVVAERQGQAAARAMLGQPMHYAAVPFFWSKHFDFSVRYVGHAERWDTIAVEGDLGAGKAVLRYRKDGRDLAVATVGEDIEALEAERKMQGGANSL